MSEETVTVESTEPTVAAAPSSTGAAESAAEAPTAYEVPAAAEAPVAPAAPEEKPAAKPRRTRHTKAKADATDSAAASAEVGEVAADSATEAPADEQPAPKKRRGRKPKAAKQAEEASEQLQLDVPVAAEASAQGNVNEAASQSAAAANSGDGAAEDTPQANAESTTDAAPAAPTTRRRRRREPAASDVVAALTEMTLVQGAAPAEGAAPSDAAPAGAQGEDAAEGDAPTEGPSRRRRHKNAQQADQQRGAAQQQQQQQAGNNARNNRRNRRKGAQDKQTAPSLTREELEEMKVADLRAKAAELGVDAAGRRKKELVDDIYAAAAAAEGFRNVEGVLQLQQEGYGIVRTGNFGPGDNDAFVHQQMVRQLGLRSGDRLAGMVGPGRGNNKYPPMLRIDTINGKLPEEAKHRPRFRDLTPIYPNERLVMEHGKDSITGRAIDLVAPIGKGQRGLIVSPPKAGKTTVLKRICQSIAANNPEVHLFCLLVDERPEEVTDMERSIRGDVVASTFDMPASNHTAVAEMVIEHAKRLVEMGEDVVVVLDSITRLARAYNLAQPASGRILSGGVDSAALYPPKKFLGAARNIENGGSLTILASALVDTGSKMDEVIFEEFKGTGNMELKLDRDLADRRIFPAIDPVASGTRNEDLLIDAEMQPFVWGIRRVLANMNNTERAATALVKGLKSTNDNAEFLIRSAKKAAQSDYVA
jgi:transcription termination factor Rho